MEDVIKELRIINQRLSNLELEVKEGQENRKDLEFQVKDLDKRFESLRGEFQEKKVKFTSHLNSRFEDDSFASSSRDFQQRDNLPRDVALSNLNSGELAGKSKLLIVHYFSRMIMTLV